MESNATTQELAVVDTQVTLPANVINYESVLEHIDELLADDTEAVSVSAEYYPFEKAGDKSRGVFVGFRDVTFKDDTATAEAGGVQQYQEGTAVAWMTRDKKCYLAAGVALVREFKVNNIAPGVPVEIEMIGKKERTKLFRVSVLVAKKK